MMKDFTLSENRNTFGGTICQSDFCTDYEGTRHIADRIASDWRFNRRCQKNIEIRERAKRIDEERQANDGE